jgi:hypothetical protein
LVKWKNGKMYQCGASVRCSAKHCNNRGIFFEKIANAQLGGWFCKSCRDQLKALDIFSQE